jgi:hypothetical protein
MTEMAGSVRVVTARLMTERAVVPGGPANF